MWRNGENGYAYFRYVDESVSLQSENMSFELIHSFLGSAIISFSRLDYEQLVPVCYSNTKTIDGRCGLRVPSVVTITRLHGLQQEWLSLELKT